MTTYELIDTLLNCFIVVIVYDLVKTLIRNWFINRKDERRLRTPTNTNPPGEDEPILQPMSSGVPMPKCKPPRKP